MEISLLSVRNDAKKRFEDIQTMFIILENNEKVDCQLVLKSSLILMMYNALEGVFSNILTELFDIIHQKSLCIDNLPEKLQTTIYTYYLKKIGQNTRKLKKYIGYDSIQLCEISYLEINKYLKLFSGNLDSHSIRKISCELGIDLPKELDEPVLLKIKNYRNKLAHGETKFSDVCQDITYDEMKDICKKIKKYLENVIDTYENFIKRRLISTDR